MDSSAKSERLLLIGALSFALVAICTGYYLAQVTCDAHWMNRAGAAIVGAEAVIALVEFRRRERLEGIRHRTLMLTKVERNIRTRGGRLLRSRAVEFVEREIRRAELQVLVIAIFLAMLGEVLHGFGDLLLEVLHR